MIRPLLILNLHMENIMTPQTRQKDSPFRSAWKRLHFSEKVYLTAIFVGLASTILPVLAIVHNSASRPTQGEAPATEQNFDPR